MKEFLAWTRNRILHFLTVVLALVVLIAAKGYFTAFPIRSAMLMFLFSGTYLGAAIATGQAYFLYPMMILGAFGYFLILYAVGVSILLFPLLSIPLAMLLWGAAICTERLERPDVPRTLVRGMGMTALLFSAWALWDLHVAAGQASVVLRFSAALAFFGYCLLYGWYHRVHGRPVGGYVACVYLVGAVLATLDMVPCLPLGYYGPFVAASALVMAVYGRTRHRPGGMGLAQPFYVSALAVLALAMAFSILDSTMWQLSSLGAALTGWAGYLGIVAAVPAVARASMSERHAARTFYYTTMAVGAIAPVAALLTRAAFDPVVSLSLALLAGLYVWVAVVRRGSTTEGRAWAVYLAAGLAGSAACVLLSFTPPGNGAPGAELRLLPLAALCIALHCVAAKLRAKGFVPEAVSAVKAAVLVSGITFAFCLRYSPATGWLALAVAAAFLTAVLMHPESRSTPGSYYVLSLALPFAAYVVATQVAPEFRLEILAGIAVLTLLWAALWGPEVEEIRPVLLYTWLVLGLIIAVLGLVDHGPNALMGQGLMLLLIGLVAGLTTRDDWGTILFRKAVHVLAGLMVVAIVVTGGLFGSPGWIGLAFVLGGAGFTIGSFISSRNAHAIIASLLFAAGYYIILVDSPTLSPGALALLGLPLLAIVYGFSVAIDRALPRLAFNVRDVGHLTAAALGGLFLIRGWPVAQPGASLGAAANVTLGYALLVYVVLYLFLWALRRRHGFGIGAAGAFSLSLLFFFSGRSGVPYYAVASSFSLIAVLWAAVGLLCRRLGKESGAVVAFATAVWVAVLCAGLVMIAPHAEAAPAPLELQILPKAEAAESAEAPAAKAETPAAGSKARAGGQGWLVFLCNALVHLALLATYRRDVFAYLLTLSLGLLAYTWLRSASTHFTQEVMFYLIVAIFVVGGLFLLPTLGRALSRVTALPTLFVFTWRGALLSALPVIALAAVGFMLYSIALVEHPRFCSSCHNMTSFAAEWHESSHGNVACVACHYEPGLASLAQGKIAGTIQLLKYVTHSYGMTPRAEVSDASCLRSNCHAPSGEKPVPREVTYLRDIKFSHEKHVFDKKWAWRAHLSCVSCHPSIAHGPRQTTAKETCFACHFYRGGEDHPDLARADCRTCHGPPKDKVTGPGGTEFTHSEIIDRYWDLKCEHCHKSVTRGDGHVNQARCSMGGCHAEPEKRPSTAAIHENHVSVHQFACAQCHESIRHGGIPMTEQMLTTTECHSCHSAGGHAIHEKVFMGTALPGFKGTGSPKYAAGVSCGACHLERLSQEESDHHRPAMTKKVTQATCDSCHTKEQACVLERWPKEYGPKLTQMRAACDKLTEQFRAARARFGEDTEERKEVETASKQFARFEKWLRILELDASKGAHNPGFYEDALDEMEWGLEEVTDTLDGLE